jgi:stress-induced morphogen
LTVGTIKNNMNWSKGLGIIDKTTGKKTTIYLLEKGAAIRTKSISSQLSPKSLYPKVKLINRTLYDLIPGRIHAIDIYTMKDFGNYANQRELWINLNPNSLDEFNSLPSQRVDQVLRT